MRTELDERPAGPHGDGGTHVWVGAALVGMGQGNTERAEHAARTGRHVLSARTRIEVLEVYCCRCRVPYSERECRCACGGPALRDSVHLAG